MAQVTETPIAAHIHFDDVEKVWRVKASRSEFDGTKFKAWAELIEKAATLAELIIIILNFFAAAPSGSGITTTAEKMNLAFLLNQLQTMEAYQHADAVSPPSGAPTYPGADPDLPSTVSDFGVTTP